MIVLGCEIGYIKTRSRQGVVEEHPLASISIAVVTNLNKTMESHLEYGEIAAELKEYLKSLHGSNYIIDRRKNNSINQTPDRSNIISIFQNSKAYVK